MISTILNPYAWRVFLGGTAAGACGLIAVAVVTNALKASQARWAARCLGLGMTGALIAGLIPIEWGGRFWGFAHATELPPFLLATSALALHLRWGSALASRRPALMGVLRLLLGGMQAGSSVHFVSALEVPGRGAPPLDWVHPGWFSALLLTASAASGTTVLALAASKIREESKPMIHAILVHLMSVMIVAELAVLTGFTWSLRGVSGMALQGWPGMLIPLFVVPVGLLFPLLARQGSLKEGSFGPPACVLIGNFALLAALAGIPATLSIR